MNPRNELEEEPPPPKPAPARPLALVRLAKEYNAEAPLAPNDQKVLLQLMGVSSAAARAPLDLVAIIDISGSMGGPRLESAKNALSFIVHKLTGLDRLSIVTFDDKATLLCHLRRVTEAGRAELEALVGRLETSGGQTNIEAGIRTGFTVVSERRFTTGRAANIMLMSDGEQTESYGVATDFTDPGNVPIHTVGFGAGHNPTDLKKIAARSLGGVYHYVTDDASGTGTTTNLSETFSQILAGLLTIIAQDLELTITPVPGEATIKDVYAGAYTPVPYPTRDGSPVTVRFGTLYSEETRSILLELALPDRSTAARRYYHADVAKVQYRFTTLQGEPVISRAERVTIRRIRSAAHDTPPPVAVRVQEARRWHLVSLEEAMREADTGNLPQAQHILQVALEALERIVHPLLEVLWKEVQWLQDLFETEQKYKQEGRPTVIAAIASHGCERYSSRGAASDLRPYATGRMDTYRGQVQYGDVRMMTSADDDERLEYSRPASTLADDRTAVSVVLRLLTALLSLLAFSIMASARTSGWEGDFYARYQQYRLIDPHFACTPLHFFYFFFRKCFTSDQSIFD